MESRLVKDQSPKSSARSLEGSAELDCPGWERFLDVLFSLIALVLVSPVFLSAVALVKLVSNGPAIYKQKRIGYLGQEFMIYKLRTMHVASESDRHEKHSLSLIKKNQPMRKLDCMGDNRLIPFGRFLRASGIDEIPQFINILKREMSFSGPRPCLPSEYDAFSEGQAMRFQTLPGLTGLWQVSGKNRLTFEQMVELDLLYVQRKSVWLYLCVLLRTPGVLLGQTLESTKVAEITLIDNDIKDAREKQSPAQVSL